MERKHQQEFQAWIDDDNVIKTKGGYLEQSTQYKKLFKTEDELYEFFIKQYYNDEYIQDKYKESKLSWDRDIVKKAEPTKTESASKVLQLMDNDYEYMDAVKKVSKEDNISVEQLERELDEFI